MALFRARMELGFSHFGMLVYRHRLKTIFLMLLLAGSLISQVPKITFDTSTESFFHQDDPAMINYTAFRDQFGRDEFIVIAIKPPDVFQRSFLEKLQKFHRTLEKEVPHLKEVNSLINIRNTRGEKDTLVVEDLLKTLPDSKEAMAALRKRVLSSELYPNLIISEDGRFTTVLLETRAFSSAGAKEGDLTSGFGEEQQETPGKGPKKPAMLSDAENSQVIAAVSAVMQRFEGPDFRLHLAGSPVVTDHLKRAMQSNMGRFMALALLTIAVFLLILFRRFSGVLLPMLVVFLSLVSTVGMMALSGVSFKLPLMILPSFLLAVGIGASVHMLSIFYRHFDREGDKEAALRYALGHSGLPILMTSITTAAGLLSFITAALAAVGDLGLFAAIGVMLALVYTLVLIPALLSLLPIHRGVRFGASAKKGGAPQGGSGADAQPHGLIDRLLVFLGDFSTARPWTVILVAVLLVGVGAAGLPSLNFSHNTLLWFPKTDPLRISTVLIDKELKGSISVEMVIDTGKKNGLYDPAVLKAMEEMGKYAEAYRNDKGRKLVGKTNSVADVVKEIHRALNENKPEFYRLPTERNLIAQELLLFENSGSDDLERLVDSRFSKARISIKTPWDDAATYVAFLADLKAEGERRFQGLAQVTPTGLLMLFTRSIFALMNSMVTSYTIAIIVITLLMIILIGRIRLGILSMIPNLSPILITMGFMGWMGIPLDTFTLLIGSIALGLAVDDTIHFFHNYLRYYQQSGDPAQAVRETLLSTGRAMLFTTLVLVSGFWLFMFASLNNLFYFGLLTGIALFLALLADLMLAPAMMMAVHRMGYQLVRK